jgi:hypothetical protein
MYATLIALITTTLGQVTQVKEVFSAPKTKIDKFPAVYFQPAGMENSFETRVENKKYYRFLALVIVGTQGTTKEHVFNTVLPATVDAIVAKFDAEWNGGTIDGHRVTVKVDSADQWEVSQEQDGIVCYAPLNIEVMVLTTN